MPKGNGAFLDREAFLALTPEVHEVKLEGGRIHVRGLTGQERNYIEKEVAKHVRRNEDMVEALKPYVLLRGICDAQGNRIFDDDHEERLGKVATIVLDEVFDRIWELSGLKVADVEALAKTSGSATSAASTSS